MPLKLEVGDLHVAVTEYLSCWSLVHFYFPWIWKVETGRTARGFFVQISKKEEM